MDVSIAGTRRLLARRTPLLVLVAFGALAFLLILAFGAPAMALGLDPAWTEVMAWAFLHHVQWGRELIFTYGPLGFLQPYASYVSGIFPWFAAGQIVLPATFALTIVLLFRRAALGAFLLFALAYACWCSHLAGDICWALTLLFGTACLIDRRIGASRLAFYGVVLLLAPVFSAIALAKFSLFPLWILCVAGVVAHCLFERRRLRALAFPLIALGALIITWWACGQALANLPLFLLRSFQVAAGYGHAMGDRAPLLYEFVAPAFLGAMLSILAYAAWQVRTDRNTLIVIGLVAATTVLFWLACFTRGDHWPWFFPAIGLLPFALVGCEELMRNTIVRRLLQGMTVAVILVACRVVGPGPIAAEVVSRPQNALRNLMHLQDLRRRRDEDWVALVRKSNLPKMRARIGRERVDMVTWEQGLLIVNGFNYAPRPLFQSYSAFTPALARINEAYFLGPDAPKFVMFKLDFIDDRVPMSEDGLALIALLRLYRPILSERGFLLLQRDISQVPATPVVPDADRQAPATLGVDIPIDENTGPTVGFFKIDLSPFGKVYTLLFREPALTLVAKTKTGEIRHRLVRATAASGFVVSPPIETNNDWVNQYFSMPLPEVVSLRIEPESSWDRPIFEDALSVSFQPIQTLHADPKTVSTDIGGLLLYPGFTLAPSGTGKFKTIVEDGEESVFLHAPASIEFQPVPGHYRLRAVYGIQGIAIRDAGCVRAKPDGVGVGAVVRRGDQEIEVAHEQIDPFHVPRDAGPHTLQVAGFDVEPGDVVEYRVDAGPAGNNTSCDWTYVRDVAFTRVLLPTAASTNATPARARPTLAGFNIAPANTGLRTIVEDGKQAVFLHAPTALMFEPPAGRYDIGATFGIQNIAVADTGCTKAGANGVGVSFVLRHAGKDTILQHAEIDPFRAIGDRGPHALSAKAVTIANGDRLEYRVDPGHGGTNASCDWSYVRDLVFTLREHVPSATAATAVAATTPAYVAGFNIAPITGGLRTIVDDGSESVFLHAPATVNFQPAAGRYDIAATFGIQNIAVDDPGCAKAGADGVGVSILLRHAGRESVLHHSEVDPFRDPADRGPHRLTVADVSIAPHDNLYYRVDPGHGGSNTSCDWSYLRDFVLTRRVDGPSAAANPR